MSGAPDPCWRRIGVYGGDHSCPLLAQTLHCRNCQVFSDAARTMFGRPSEPESAAPEDSSPDSSPSTVAPLASSAYQVAPN